MKRRTSNGVVAIPGVCDAFTPMPDPADRWCAGTPDRPCGWRWNLHADEAARRGREAMVTPQVLRLDEDADFAHVIALDAAS